MEIISPEGLRQDGRSPTCLRTINCHLGLYDRPNGSAYIEMGNTKVLAAVYGPREVRSISKQNLDECVIQCEMSRIAASRGERVKRPRDQRSRALSQQIAGVFHAAIRKSKYPGSQIDIYVQVVQEDGGVMSACVNASTLALIHAGVELVDYVTSCTASIHHQTPILDATSGEGLIGCEVAVSLLPNKDLLVSLDSAHTVHRDQFETVMDLATAGCQQVYQILLAKVETYLQDKHAIMSHR